MKKIIFFLLVTTAVLFSQEETEQTRVNFDGTYPFDKSKLSVPPLVNKNRFELSIDSKMIDKTQRDIEKKENMLDGTLNLSVLQKPLTRVLKTIDTLYLHPSYLTTIIMPKNTRINTALASFTTKEFSYNENVLILQPSLDARNGNVILSLSDGKNNYMITLFIKQYFPELDCKESGSNYKCMNDYLTTTIRYVAQERLTTIKKFEIIEEYLKISKKEKIEIVENLSFVTLEKNGVTYYIIRDDEFGDISKSGISLTIKNSL